MKWIIFYIILITAWACSVKNADYIKKRDLVNISSVSVPRSASVSEQVAITAVAQANNGCWHDFDFKLVKISDFNYTLKAYATYESKGICAQVIVEKDTILTFIPEKAGQYVFHTNDAPFKVVTDTLTVN